MATLGGLIHIGGDTVPSSDGSANIHHLTASEVFTSWNVLYWGISKLF